MELTFNVSGRIAKPVAEVFEAVADPAKLSRYFTTGGARGRMEKGTTVTWSFHDFPGEFPVRIIDAVPNEKLAFQWGANEGPDAGAPYDTTVTIGFEALEDGRTLVTITEEGWRETPGGLKASYGNCQGWMQMLCCLKAWLEHGINLREGMFK
ncbi:MULTISPECIES: SRPBCC family protein [unclassified Rhizobium]|uniref:SRPBCC family protein n=1 Tax=unclassified Rhizobium TaxID=2613769 RepID=UPI0006FE9C2C|nr:MULTISPECIES: SRPBCC family protein [unclassified Rhizobium]KQV39135.1 ATPase [Rhizobium sp. Root1212]KRD35109.1 ATPase [Rhizobium sp. Root268]